MRPAVTNSGVSDSDLLNQISQEFHDLKSRFAALCDRYDAVERSLASVQESVDRAVCSAPFLNGETQASYLLSTMTHVQQQLRHSSSHVKQAPQPSPYVDSYIMHPSSVALSASHPLQSPDSPWSSPGLHATTLTTLDIPSTTLSALGSPAPSATDITRKSALPSGILSFMHHTETDNERALEELTDRLAYKHFEYTTTPVNAPQPTVSYRAFHNNTANTDVSNLQEDGDDALDDWLDARNVTEQPVTPQNRLNGNIWSTKLSLGLTTTIASTSHQSAEDPKLTGHSSMRRLSASSSHNLLSDATTEGSEATQHVADTAEQQLTITSHTELCAASRHSSSNDLLALQSQFDLSHPTYPPDFALISPVVLERIDELIESFQPTLASEERYEQVYKYLTQLIKQHSGCTDVIIHGSVASKIYLPDSDVDLTIITNDDDQQWVQKIVLALLQASNSNKPTAKHMANKTTKDGTLAIKSLSYINAYVHLIKTQVGAVSVDISSGQVGAVASLALFEEVDRLVGYNHLFKRSLLLIKAYAQLELHIIASHRGLLSSYCLRTMVLYIFNAYHAQIRHPFAALALLMWYLRHFDFQQHALSVFGPMQLAHLPQMVPAVGCATAWPADVQPLIPQSLIQNYAQLAQPRDHSSMTAFEAKHINVIDAINPTSNLGRSVSFDCYPLVIQALTNGATRLNHVLNHWNDATATNSSITDDNIRMVDNAYCAVSDLFQGTIQRYSGHSNAFMSKRRLNLRGKRLVNTDYSVASASHHATAGTDVFECDLKAIMRSLTRASQLDAPMIQEHEIITGIYDLLMEFTSIPVGKLGSKLHQKLNNHHLPQLLKSQYGGLRKFLERRCSDLVIISDDHQFNPSVSLNSQFIAMQQQAQQQQRRVTAPIPTQQQQQYAVNGFYEPVQSFTQPMQQPTYQHSYQQRQMQMNGYH